MLTLGCLLRLFAFWPPAVCFWCLKDLTNILGDSGNGMRFSLASGLCVGNLRVLARSEASVFFFSVELFP